MGVRSKRAPPIIAGAKVHVHLAAVCRPAKSRARLRSTYPRGFQRTMNPCTFRATFGKCCRHRCAKDSAGCRLAPNCAPKEDNHRSPGAVTFATRYGSTAETAQAVVRTLRDRGVAVEAIAYQRGRVSRPYGAVVLGAALYVGRPHNDARQFLAVRRAAIRKMPVAVFVPGPVDTLEKDWAGARQELDKELARYPWFKSGPAGWSDTEHSIRGSRDFRRSSFPRCARFPSPMRATWRHCGR